MPRTGRESGRIAARLEAVLVDLAAWQIGFGLVLAGAMGLYLSSELEGPHGPGVWDTTLREGAALLFVTAALSVVWDLRGRRKLSNEVLAAVGLSEGITKAGLTRVTTHYGDIDWIELIDRASNVDLFFAYGSTWRNSHDAALRALVRRDGTHLRVVLPDRQDESQMAQLEARFGAPADEISQKILEAENAFANLHREAAPRASVEVRVTGAFPVFTYYRFDGRCIGVLYAQAGERVEVPAFECERGGTLHTFFSGQFDVLWDGSSTRSLK